MTHHGKENSYWQAVLLKKKKGTQKTNQPKKTQQQTPGLFVRQIKWTNMVSKLESYLPCLVWVWSSDFLGAFYCLDTCFCDQFSYTWGKSKPCHSTRWCILSLLYVVLFIFESSFLLCEVICPLPFKYDLSWNNQSLMADTQVSVQY